MSICTRCSSAFTVPSGLETSLNIRASYCENCAVTTNAKFSSIYSNKEAWKNYKLSLAKGEITPETFALLTADLPIGDK
jgi:hypothetical protein